MTNQMLNKFKSIAKKLEADFEGSAATHHQGIKGGARENALAEQLGLVLPGRCSVGTGEVIDIEGNISKQQDLVIYDGFNIPVFQDFGNTKVFFAEQVYAVIEVKSAITSREVKAIVEQAQSIKSLKPGGPTTGLGVGIPVFGFAYKSRITLEKVRDCVEDWIELSNSSWGVTAILVLEDSESESGLVTNVFPHFPRAIKLEPGRESPIAAIKADDAGSALLAFYLVLMEAIKNTDLWLTSPNYLSYADAGGLGIMRTLLGPRGTKLLSNDPQSILKMLQNPNESSRDTIIKAWNNLMEFLDRNAGVTEEAYFILDAQLVVQGPTPYEIKESCRRYIHGSVVESDEVNLDFLVSFLRDASVRGLNWSIEGLNEYQ